MSGSTVVEIVTHSPDETREIGRRLGMSLRSGDVVLLNGDLGAAKTTFAQGIALGLGVGDYVQSPTFTLVQEHSGRTLALEEITLYHLDLYRLADESDLESIGFEQFLEPVDGISVIEWPERARGWLPERYLLVDLTIAGLDARRLRFVAHGTMQIDGKELLLHRR